MPKGRPENLCKLNRGLQGLLFIRLARLIPLSNTKENRETRVRFFGGSTINPFNFLANGVTGSPYDLPVKDKDHKTALAVWKLASSEGNAALHGFGEADQPLKGLSLLFDPVVDFSLASQMFRNGILPASPIVLILTDYYPIDQRYVIPTIERC